MKHYEANYKLWEKAEAALEKLDGVYDVTVSDKGEVDIRMTVTAPACPVAGELPQWVADAVDRIEGTGEIEVHLVWDPPWDQSLMSEDAKMALGMF